MNYILDTCAMIWLGMGGGDLSSDARRRITVASTLYYSAISAWELTRLQKEGKLILPTAPEDFIEDLSRQYDIVEVPVTKSIAIRAAQLPYHHRDPADRLIIATAVVRNLPVITGDEKFPQYGVKTIS